MLDLRDSHKLEELVNSATDEGEDEGSRCSPRLLSDIKRIARKSDALVSRAFEILMEKLRDESSQTRVLALEVVHALMLRSKVFRDNLVNRFNEFLDLTVALKAKARLPPPKESAERLRTRTLEAIREWSRRFGAHYKSLGHAERYIANFLASSSSAGADEPEGEGNEDRDRVQGALHDEVLGILRDLPEFKADAAKVRSELETFLDLLEETLARRWEEDPAMAAAGSGDGGDGDGGAHGCEGLSLYAVDEEDPRERSESAIRENFVATFRDFLAVLHKRFLHKTRSWGAALRAYDPKWGDMTRSHEVLSRDLRGIEASLQSTQVRSRLVWDQFAEGGPYPTFEDAGAGRGGGGPNAAGAGGGQSVDAVGDLGGSDDEDGVEFEDAPMTQADHQPLGSVLPGVSQAEADGPGASAQVRAPLLDPTVRPQRARSGGGSRTGADKVTATSAHLSSVVRTKLLREAPVVAAPESVEVDEGCAVFANDRGLDIGNHWGPTDDSAIVPRERAKIFSRRVAFYEPPPESAEAKIRICGARMANGRLCQRRDKKVCPFHGPIVPRDPRGLPLSPTGKAAPSTSGEAGKTQREIDKEANLKILRELSGGKRYQLPRASSRGRGREGGLSRRKRLEEKLGGRKAPRAAGANQNRRRS